MSGAILSGGWTPMVGWDDESLERCALRLRDEISSNRARLGDSYRTVESLQIARTSIEQDSKTLAHIRAIQAQRRQLRVAS